MPSRTRSAAPPESALVHFVERAKQHLHTALFQGLQVDRKPVEAGLPDLIKRAAVGDEVAPLLVAEMAHYAPAPAAYFRLVRRGHVGHQLHDAAFVPLPLALADHLRAIADVVGREEEIAAP